MTQNDEFANMWKSLQGAKQPSSTESSLPQQLHLEPNSVTQESDIPPSFQLAASTLINIPVPNSGKTDSTVGRKTPQLSSQSESCVGGKTDTSDDSEFSAIFKSLDISKDQTVIKKAKQTEENSLITDTPKQVSCNLPYLFSLVSFVMSTTSNAVFL